MLSRTKIREIRSLEIKKFRDERGLFVAEGNKLVTALLPAFECEWLIAYSSWIAAQGDIPAKELVAAQGEADMRRVSFLKTPPDVVAVMRKPSCTLHEVDPESELVLALDGVQDPGNLGTIVRLADWFGIRHIVCSRDTADVYSPKTVQATMGALAHVRVHYTDLEAYVARSKNAPVYGAFLCGKNIYEEPLARHGLIVMGNEGQGIRPGIATMIQKRLFIPSYPPSSTGTSESLNVAVAAAVVCAEFRRVASGY